LVLELDATTRAFAKVVSTLHSRGGEIITLTWSNELRHREARITVIVRADRRRHEHIRKALARLVDVTTVHPLADV
jgi:acetolactate synthase small subunit